MRGRKPQPVGVQKALGSPGHRRARSVVAVRRLRPDLPKWAGVEARKFLETVLPELERLGVLSVVDGGQLAAMGEDYADLIFWRAELARERKKKTRDRDEIRRVQREVRSADDAFRKWATEYGLTEVSRTRIGDGGSGGAADTPNPDEDDLDD